MQSVPRLCLSSRDYTEAKSTSSWDVQKRVVVTGQAGQWEVGMRRGKGKAEFGAGSGEEVLEEDHP